MSVALNPKKVRRITLPEDEKLAPEARPFFLVRSLTKAEELDVTDSTESEGTAGTRDARAMLKTVRIGLMGWGNFRDEDGDEAVYARSEAEGLVSMESIDALSTSALIHLSRVILNDSRVTRTEAGKS